ncbi:MAG TPA: UvrD-helicase domain-containing protein [Bryobacteraceae bacterium]|nr:UvrD-helicase domain-containing protein [Bryobacteraceae bacterium]
MPVNFTKDQHSAIEYRKLDACVTAGPGSGKTTVLVERYRSLIEDHRFEPRRILAITFTEKAAANMKSKLAEKFAHDPLRLRELESAWVSTIHGFCARLLKENAIAAGIDPRFAVLDARESEELQYSCLNAALDELVEQRHAEALELIEALQTPYVVNNLLDAYDGIRSAGKTVAEIRAIANPSASVDPQSVAESLLRQLRSWPATLTPARRTQQSALLEWAQRLAESNAGSFAEFVRLVHDCPLHLGKVPESEKETLREFKETLLPSLIAWAVDRHTARFRALIFDVLTRFDDLYAERKRVLGSLDFNDLERCTVDLLRRNDDVRARIRAQFLQVMLDEFQDINEQQSSLIELVRGEDVFFAVGDINQSIYGFRHARPDIFRGYEAAVTDSGKHSVQLLDNFRSRNEILRCVESLLNGAEGIASRELVAGVSFRSKSTPSIEVLKIREDSDRDEASAREARWIAHRILSLRGTLELSADDKIRHADFSDFAVLCRNGDSMKPILEAFDHTGIPYVSGRRQSFLLSREGRDITALLHTIANPRDTIALATVLRSPLVGIGDESLLRVRLLAGSLSGGLNVISYDSEKLADFAPRDAEKIERFARNLKRWRAEQPVMPLELLLVRALADCGFQWDPGAVRGDNVENFLHLARTRGEQRDLLEFLAEIESLQKAINLESDLSDKDAGNAVQVMTAHAAKGLEFPVTIIAAMDKGTQRNSAPVTFTPAFGLGLAWNDSGGKKNSSGLDDSWQWHNSEELKDREKQEAHRLLYVAMTRAGEHLILSYSRGKNRPSNWAKIVDTLEPSEHISILETEAEPPVWRLSESRAIAEDGVLTLDRPEISGRHDSAVNVTSLAVFADCPRKYYLERYVGWNGRRSSGFDPEDLPREDDSGDADENAADLGSAVHELLAGKPGVYSDDAKRLANVFLTCELGKRVESSARVEREWDFIVDVEGTLVRGTVDLWFEDSGEIVIVDYKTDRVPDRATSYSPQLALYGLALERALGKRPKQAWLHFLRTNTLVEVPLDYDVKKIIGELRAAQNTLKFPLNERGHCRACRFYRSLCPAGQQANASAEIPASQMPARSAEAS